MTTRTVWQTMPTRRNGACNQHAVNPDGDWYTRTRYGNGAVGKWIRFSMSGREPDRSKCIELTLDVRLPGDGK